MTKNYRFLSTLLLSVSLLLAGFSAFAQQQYVNGVLMLNEGMSGTDTATISFLPTGATAIQNDIYAVANPDQTLGDTGQSLSFHGDKAYVILNLSNRLRVLNATTLQLEATLNTGLSNPRYMAFANGKGYITCWGGPNAYVAVLNLETNTIETTIPLESGIEKIIEFNGKLYVAHKGGFASSNLLSVINPVTDTLEDTIEVGDVPNSMVVNSGFLYVLCGGNPGWTGPETFGKLVKIKLSDNTIESTVDFPSLHPANLLLADGNFYYSVFEDVYKMSINATELPDEPLFSLATQQLYGIYGMDIVDETLYVTEVVGFTVASKANLYSLDGTFIQSFTAGMATNGYYKAVEVDLGMGDNSKLQMGLYPNPATNVFYLNTNEKATVTMYDLAGRLVVSQNYTTAGINVGHLSKGVYVVQTQIGNNKDVQKLIVK